MGEFRSDFGEQIVNLVDSALGSDNFEKLSEKINKEMGAFFGTSGTKTRTQGGAGRPQQNPGMNQYQTRQNPGMSQYQARQQQAMNASNAGRAAYEARRRNMMAGQPHKTAGGTYLRAGMAGNAQVPQQPALFGPAEGELSGGFLMAGGGFVAVVSLIRIFTMMLSSPSIAAAVLALVMLAAGASVFAYGLGLRNRAKRYK